MNSASKPMNHHAMTGMVHRLRGLNPATRSHGNDKHQGTELCQQLAAALIRIKESLHSNLETEKILQCLLREGAAALGSETAAISLREEGHWKVRYVQGLPVRLVEARMNDEQERHARLALRTRQPVAVGDLLHDPSVNRAHLSTGRIRAVLVAPLVVRDKPFGALFFNYHRAPQRFSEPQIQFAAQVGAAASIALENGRLFDELRRAQEMLEQFNATFERRVAERTESLTNSNERLRAIMDAALNSIITLDSRGRIESLNLSALRTFGYAPNEIVGQNVSRLLMAAQQAQDEAFLPRFLRARQRRGLGVRGEAVGKCKNGRKIMLGVSVAEFSEGGRHKFVLTACDITADKRLERELLEISEQVQRQIGQDLHDDLCQQLTGIEFLARTLERQLAAKLPAEAARAREITKWTKQAITHARELAHGMTPLELETGGLAQALRGLTARVKKLFDIDCRFRDDSQGPVDDPLARIHLYRIAQEAVNNAIKHGKAGRIEVRLAVDHNKVVLRVQDNGSGLPPKRPDEGFGLRIMEHRASNLGGSLAVQRGKQGGTILLCRIPRFRAAGVGEDKR